MIIHCTHCQAGGQLGQAKRSTACAIKGGNIRSKWISSLDIAGFYQSKVTLLADFAMWRVQIVAICVSGVKLLENLACLEVDIEVLEATLAHGVYLE